jgi:hypothetical protein
MNNAGVNMRGDGLPGAADVAVDMPLLILTWERSTGAISFI